MKRPEMILFDYGHTLVHEISFDPKVGYAAVLEHAVKNPDNATPDDMDALYKAWRTPMNAVVVGAEYEMPALQYDKTVYDALGLEFDVTPEELEVIYWNAGCPYEAMDGVGEMLQSLKEMGIRTGVISNLSFSEHALKSRIYGVIPDAPFEFFMASSTYGYRKPHESLFRIACRKAGLQPSQMFYCGDNTRADVFGAHQAGMTPVWYQPPVECFYRPKELDVAPDFDFVSIHHWRELTEFVRSL